MVPAVFPDDLRELPPLLGACQAQLGDLSIVYALGLHPYALPALREGEDIPHLEALERAVEANEDPRLRAVGECGLHFAAHDGEPIDRARQVALTRRQLTLARRTGLPAILHCVQAHGPMLELLDEAPTPPSVLHSFTGGASLALEYTRRGHYVSFSGSVTQPRARKVLEAVRSVPDDRLLIETDSPDQTPSPASPGVNEPANVRMVANAVAHLRDTDTSTVARITFDNAVRVFRMEDILG